jgi:hypothetical protein
MASQRRPDPYSFGERASQALWRRLSSVSEVGFAENADCDEMAEALIQAEERRSWLLPYLMRAKLRFDMASSHRKLRRYLFIVRHVESKKGLARQENTGW